MSNRKPKKERIRALREEALELLRKGSNAAALIRFAELERLAPDVAEFPQRAADCHRNLGDATQQVDALGRAVELYANEGALAKAVALCKVILAIDPEHGRTGARLAELSGALQPARVEPEPPRPKPVPRLPIPAVSVPATRVPAVDLPVSVPAGESPSGAPKRPRRSLEQMLRLRRAELAKAKLPSELEPATSSGEARGIAEDSAPTETIPAPEAPPADGMIAVPESLMPEESDVAATDSVLAAPDGIPRVSASVLIEPSASIPVLEPYLSEPAPDSVSDTATTNPLPPAGEHPVDLCEARLATPANPRLLAERVLPMTPLFSELGPQTLSVLVENAKLLHFEPDAVVYRENDPSDLLFVVANGLVSIATEGEDGLELARLGEHEWFGETALISNELRLSTARAVEATDVFAIERKTVNELVREDPSMRETVLRFLRERLVEAMLLTNPLFTLLTGGERRELAKRFEFAEFERGTRLVRQRSRSPGVFVLLCGTVEVTRREGSELRLLALLHAGDVFGEMSLIGRDPAVADVRSLSRGFALMLPENEFRRVCDEHPQVREFLQLLAEARKRQNAQPLPSETIPANA
jgi:CRP-like cAMP-binding protein